MNAPASAIPIIFAITARIGIAIGRVPGLKFSRVGIALLGAIAMMLFSRLVTQKVIACVNWPTILLLFGFFGQYLGATPACPEHDKVAS